MIQDKLLEALQPQPASAVTLTLLLPPSGCAGTLGLFPQIFDRESTVRTADENPAKLLFHHLALVCQDGGLAGKTPAEIPYTTARRVNLTVNLKTAQKLGMEIPQSILGMASNIIQ